MKYLLLGLSIISFLLVPLGVCLAILAFSLHHPILGTIDILMALVQVWCGISFLNRFMEEVRD